MPSLPSAILLAKHNILTHKPKVNIISLNTILFAGNQVIIAYFEDGFEAVLPFYWNSL